MTPLSFALNCLIFALNDSANAEEMVQNVFCRLWEKKETINIKVDKAKGEWLYTLLPLISVNNSKTYTLQEVQANYETAGLEDFELFWDNKPVSGLSKVGLLML